MHNIHDIKLIFNQDVFIFNAMLKGVPKMQILKL